MSAQDALVAVMVAVSVSDQMIRTSELLAIQRMVDSMPIFAEYDIDRMRSVAQTVFTLLDVEDGLDALFGIVRAALPERLYETAYAMACDIAASGGTITQAELRLLEEIGDELTIDRLHAAAIERGARARHMT